MVLSKRGVVPLVFVLVAVALVVSTGVYFVATENSLTNSITGAVTGLVAGKDGGELGIQKITSCNITLIENISNIGHDYECTGANGFFIGAEDLVIDCQNHSITCVGSCDGMAGFVLDGDSGTTIQNCRIYNFEDGFKLTNGASNNLFSENTLQNNSDGIDFNNATSNNVTLSYFYNNSACGVNISNLNNTADIDGATFNNVWNNMFYANGTSPEACADLTSRSYWYLEKNCEINGTNIIGGPCLGGNYWETYDLAGYKDITGDGLGDVQPYYDGSIQSVGFGDKYPLVDPCDMPGVIGEDTTCPNEELLSDTGEGMAIVSSNTLFECNGTVLNGNRSGEGGDWTWENDMRGVEIVGVHNVTVRGCDIHDFKYGIYISNAYNITIENNHIHNNNHTGIYVTSLSYGINITNNIIDNNVTTGTNQSYGVQFIGSYPSTDTRESWIRENTISNSTAVGVYLYSNSDYIDIWDNVISGNNNGTVVKSSKGVDIQRNLFDNNDQTGLYLKSATTIANLGETGNQNNFTNNNIGFKAKDSTTSTSKGVYSLFEGNSLYGLQLVNSPFNIDYANVSGSQIGILYEDGSDIALDGITAFNNSIAGIYLDSITGVNLPSSYVNNIYNNSVGIYLYDSNLSSFEYMYDDDEGYVFSIFNNSINLQLNNSHQNNFSGLRIFNGTVAGINLTEGSSYNLFYDNKISDNFQNAQDNGNNFWNTSKTDGSNIIGGFTLGGNYWSDYEGDDTTGDGIGDEFIPHSSSEGITALLAGDYYPLVGAGNASCSTLTHDVDVYQNVTADSGSCFVIGADDVTLDCHGNSITGNGTNTDYGIKVQDYDNAVIKNCVLENFTNAILIQRSNNTLVYNNSIFDSVSLDIHLDKINNSNVSKNVINTHNSSIYSVLINSVLDTNIEENIFMGDHNLSLFITKTNQTNFTSNLVNDSMLVSFYVQESNNNTFTNNWIQNSSFAWYLNESNYNLIYNNFINATTEVFDNNTNYWNTTYSCDQTNILGESCIGGNFWASYSGSDDGSGIYPYNVSLDGIGDTNVPYYANASSEGINSTTSFGDALPLVSIPTICGPITHSSTMTQNLTSEGDCFIIAADDITLDFDGFYLTGNSSGIGVNISSHTGVNIINANIINFSYGVYVDPSSEINISVANISDSDYGVYFDYVNNSTIENTHILDSTYAIVLNNSLNNSIYTNNITNNDLGIWVESSTGNLVYNNFFNNTQNAQDDGSSNNWNTSYQELTTNIVGGSAFGGNYWSDYAGVDNGLAAYPHDTSGDGVGDTQLPYQTSLTGGGDYLPLTSINGSMGDDCQDISSDTILEGPITCPSGDGVTVLADDITLDCQGYTITGDGTDSGILIENRDGVTIRNCEVKDFYYGIKVVSSTNTNITDGNIISENDFYGIYLHGSNDTTIDSNDISNDNNGVYSISSDGTRLTNNTINLHKKFYAYYGYNSDDTVIYNNTMYNNYHDIYFVGSDGANVSDNALSITDVYSIFLHSGSDSSIIQNNTLTTGKHGIYLKSNSVSNTLLGNTITDHTSSGIYVKESPNNNVEDNIIQNNSQNLVIYSSRNSNLSSNIVKTAATGVDISNSESVRLSHNTINATAIPVLNVQNATGIYLYNNTFYDSAVINYSSSAYLEANNMTEVDPELEFNITNSDYHNLTDNTFEFVFVSNATGPLIQENTLLRLIASDLISAEILGNTLQNNPNVSIQLLDVDSSTIADNTVKSTAGGISLNNSDSNILYDNWLQSNSFGINLSSSTSNEIYNNYLENSVNVYEDAANIWQTTYSCTTPNIVGGPCQGGNFYSNYYGLDDGSESRDEGDGIGDNPSYHQVSSYSNDSYPLVLYVARQYYAPTDDATESLTANASLTGTLSNEQVLPNTAQNITYSNGSSVYAELTGLFNQSDVDASNLLIHYEEFDKTYVSKYSASGFDSSYTAYLYHNNQFDAGVYICTGEDSIDAINSSCSSKTPISSFPSNQGGYYTTVQDGYYKIDGIGDNKFGVGLETGDVCGANIYHDVTSTQDSVCSGTAFTVQASNVTIDCDGHLISGDWTGNGFNVSDVEGVTIQNCMLSSFDNALFIENSADIVLRNITVLNATSNGVVSLTNSRLNITNFTSTNVGAFGIYLNNTDGAILSEVEINSSNIAGIRLKYSYDSIIYSSLIQNNTVGLNVTDSNSNLIYNNHFDNDDINVFDNGTNSYNSSLQNGTNIFGGTLIGGNYWSDYSGWDVDNDGIGDTSLAYTAGGGIENIGDYLPLTEVGQISCGEVTTDVNMSQDVNFTTTCFNITTDHIVFDCDGHSISKYEGDASEYAIGAESRNNITIKNCNIFNATLGIYAWNTTNSTIYNNTVLNSEVAGLVLEDSTGINASNNIISYYSTEGTLVLSRTNDSYLEDNSINESFMGIRLSDSYYNELYGNIIINSTIGLNVTDSDDNLIYNNYFNNTINVNETNGANFYNTTYNCTIVNYTNIAGGNCTGGNLWSDYLGLDNANATIAGVPNETGDYVGDTLLPYNEGMVSFGDYLPLLTSTVEDDDDGAGSPPTTPTTSTTSSGGGGGGGGSSSATTTTDAVADTCTESWTCTSWSDCTDGTQTRECTDSNDCGTTSSKPSTSQSCTEEDTSTTTSDTETEGETESETSPIIEYITEEGPARTLTLSGLALLAIFGTVYAYWGFMHPAARLRRRLRGTNRILEDASTTTLKSHYAGIYKLYMKLSERNKQNFYANVTQMREHIEEQMKAQKEIEMLFDKAQFGDLQARKHVYMQIYEEYQKLPAKTQEEVYPKLVDLREQLERGVE